MNPQDFGIFLIKRSGFFQDFQISGFFDPSQNEKFQSRILWIEIFDPEKTYLKANSVFDHFATKIIQKKRILSQRKFLSVLVYWLIIIK